MKRRLLAFVIPFALVLSNASAAPVNDIRYNAAANSLYAAAYGRGIWTLQLARE